MKRIVSSQEAQSWYYVYRRLSRLYMLMNKSVNFANAQDSNPNKGAVPEGVSSTLDDLEMALLKTYTILSGHEIEDRS